MIFRPLTRVDFSMLQAWLARPHIDIWWHSALDINGIEAMYGQRVDGLEPTHVFIVEHQGRPIGWVQWHRWRDYPGHARQLGATEADAGLDLAIGEPELTGRGLGVEIIREFVERQIFLEPGIEACIADPEERNRASLRSFEKAGFTLEHVVRLDGEACTRRVVRRIRN